MGKRGVGKEGTVRERGRLDISTFHYAFRQPFDRKRVHH